MAAKVGLCRTWSETPFEDLFSRVMTYLIQEYFSLIGKQDWKKSKREVKSTKGHADSKKTATPVKVIVIHVVDIHMMSLESPSILDFRLGQSPLTDKIKIRCQVIVSFLAHLYESTGRAIAVPPGVGVSVGIDVAQNVKSFWLKFL